MSAMLPGHIPEREREREYSIQNLSSAWSRDQPAYAHWPAFINEHFPVKCCSLIKIYPSFTTNTVTCDGGSIRFMWPLSMTYPVGEFWWHSGLSWPRSAGLGRWPHCEPGPSVPRGLGSDTGP